MGGTVPTELGCVRHLAAITLFCSFFEAEAIIRQRIDYAAMH